MKKYFVIFKSELMSNLNYLLNITFSFVGCFMFLYIFLNLWEYIYTDPLERINGYTMNQMVWYVIITEIIWGVTGGRKLCRKIVNDVKGGNLTYNINKPYNYIGYLLFSHLGDACIRGVIYLILGILTGYLFLGSFPNISILSIITVLISIVLAVVIDTLLIIFIGLFSFVVEDSMPFYWIYSKMILIFGTIFPVEYFPGILSKILTYTPVYVVCYGPSKLFIDFSINKMFTILGSQIIYIIISYLLCLLIYKKGVKKLNVNGG